MTYKPWKLFLIVILAIVLFPLTIGLGIAAFFVVACDYLLHGEME